MQNRMSILIIIWPASTFLLRLVGDHNWNDSFPSQLTLFKLNISIDHYDQSQLARIFDPVVNMLTYGILPHIVMLRSTVLCQCAWMPTLVVQIIQSFICSDVLTDSGITRRRVVVIIIICFTVNTSVNIYIAVQWHNDKDCLTAEYEFINGLKQVQRSPCCS